MDLLGQDQPDPADSEHRRRRPVGQLRRPPALQRRRPVAGRRRSRAASATAITSPSSAASPRPTRPSSARASSTSATAPTACSSRDGGDSVFVRVDAPARQTRRHRLPALRQLGAQGSMWVAIMEKAYAFFRTGEGTYQSIEGGWMTEAYTALGVHSTSTFEAAAGRRC